MSGARAPLRAPWARGGLYGLIAALSPFVWVLEVGSCAGSAGQERELAGVDVFAAIDVQGWAMLVPALLLAAGAPLLAARLTAGRAALAHAAGFVATGFTAWLVAFLISFTIFSDRELIGAGWFVAGALVATLVDAAARLWLSVAAWLRSRRPPASPPPRPGG